MRTLAKIADVRAALDGHRRAESTIGLVPTMGGFHEGHLSLIRRARQECDVVVVSLFVNPSQFEDPRDLEAYPRDERRDAGLAAEYGADYLFAPAVDELYPPGFSTKVSVTGVSDGLEGAQRGRSHFDGVATVVLKLLNIVGPEVAYFGQKDAQQAVVVRRLVADLNLPARIEVCPTVREPDGLAMSSRNVHLDPSARLQATSLYRALLAVQEAIRLGEQDAAAARQHGLAELASSGVRPEYLELVSPETLAPVQEIESDVLAVVAARVGRTRLIDNLLIEPLASGAAPVRAVPEADNTIAHSGRT